MLLKRNILLVLMLIPLVNLPAQNFTLKSYTTADGLAHNNIRTIVRDSSGFLWIGTWDGLSRFDGHEFKNYFHEPDDTASIPYFSINDIRVDRCNNLWIFTDTREVVKYNRGTDDFKVISSFDSIMPDKILGISIDKKGNLILISKSYIIIQDPLKNKTRVIRLNGKDDKPYILDDFKHWITLSEDNNLWIVSGNITEFRKSGPDEFRFHREYRIEKTIDEPLIHFDVAFWRSLYVSPSGNKWLFSNNGLFCLDSLSGIFREFTDPIPKSEFTDQDFFYWGKRGNGMFIFNRKEQKLTHIADNQIKWPGSILPDGKDCYWISNSTPQGVALGLSRIAFNAGLFRNITITASDSSSPAVYSVTMDNKKRVWAGIRGFDHILQFGPDDSVTELFFLASEFRSLSDYIRSLIPVKNGVWIGHYQDLLQFYDYETGSFTRHFTGGYSFRAIAASADGNLYIGTDQLYKYMPSSGKTEVLWKPDTLVNIFMVFIDYDGIIWAGMSESRLLRYDPISKEAKIIRVGKGTANIEDIVAGENGDLWLALLGKGVCRYNTVNGTSQYYTTADGLSNNTTYSLLRDNQKHIWVSTNHGISMIDSETGHIRVFDESDGLAISEFNSGARFATDDNEFFFGGMGGFVRFFPDSISAVSENLRQQLLLTDLEVSGETRHLPGDLNKADTAVLERGENNFHLSFSSTDFLHSDKTFFRYRLDPVNNRWIETGPGNRNINYSNLKPGWYDLILEATDRNGDWATSKRIKIRIKPSFYQTRIFRIILPQLIIGFIVFGIFLYIRQLKQKERSTQDELKLQSLRSQMNPHFIFNSLNSINYFISNNDKLSANRYIADFSRLIRSILSNMGSNFIPLENEISSLIDYLRIEHLRFSDKFDYNLDVSGIANASDIEVCPGIVQPFIENSIWHGVRALEDRKGNISIRFASTGAEGLKCIIEDDGIGLVASSKAMMNNFNHKPKGISIIEERLQITGKLLKANYRIEISDLYPGRKEPGTRVIVDIPARHIKTRTS